MSQVKRISLHRAGDRHSRNTSASHSTTAKFADTMLPEGPERVYFDLCFDAWFATGQWTIKRQHRNRDRSRS
jgi:hypothetical protein